MHKPSAILCPQTMHAAQHAAHIAVATSGGADSMALTLLLYQWARPLGITLSALHVDHRLRETSSTEAQQVKAWLEQRGIACHILPINTSLHGGNLQANARNARYGLMQTWCADHDVHHLCLAHHMDDQAETVLMRLGRGSGVDGLSAMRPITQRGALTLLRPLLRERKSALQQYLTTQQQRWIDDPSNASTHYQRNALRALMPALETQGVSAKRLAQCAEHLARSADYLAHQRDAWMAQHRCLTHAAFATLPRAEFTQLHEEMRLRVLRAALTHTAPMQPELRFTHLDAAMRAMHGDHVTTRALHGCLITSKGAYYYIHREPARLPSRVGAHALWDHRFALTKGALTHLARIDDIAHFSIGALTPSGLASLRERHVPLPRWPATLLHGLVTLYHLESVIAVPHIDYTHKTCDDYSNLFASPSHRP